MKTITLNNIERFGTLDSTYLLGTKYTMSDALSEDLLSRKIEGDSVFRTCESVNESESESESVNEDESESVNESVNEDESESEDVNEDESVAPKRGRGRPKKVTV